MFFKLNKELIKKQYLKTKIQYNRNPYEDLKKK